MNILAITCCTRIRHLWNHSQVCAVHQGQTGLTMGKARVGNCRVSACEYCTWGSPILPSTSRIAGHINLCLYTWDLFIPQAAEQHTSSALSMPGCRLPDCAPCRQLELLQRRSRFPLRQSLAHCLQGQLPDRVKQSRWGPTQWAQRNCLLPASPAKQSQ